MWATLKQKLEALEAAAKKWLAGETGAADMHDAQTAVNSAVADHLAALDARVAALEGKEPGSAPDPVKPAAPVAG